MQVINMSVTAAPLIAVIAAIRFFAVYKLPKKTFYVMWGIVLYQLLAPYNLFSRLNVAELIGKIKDVCAKAPEVTDAKMIGENMASAADTPPSLFNGIFDAVDRFGGNVHNKTDLMLIWFAGIICCSAYFIIINIKFNRIYEEALPVDNAFVRAWRVEYSDSMRRKVKIRQSDLIKSPLTYGIFRPVILLPETTDYSDENTLAYILLHEYTHIRRFDVLSKLLLVTVLCVHWFNPFVWIMYILANRDIELSCDENVVKKSGIKLKSDYALTLIALESKKSMLALGVGFSSNVMKERIKSIMKIKKKSKLRMAAAVILIFLITVMFAALQSCKNDMDPADETIKPTQETTEELIITVPEEPLPESTDYSQFTAIIFNEENLPEIVSGDGDGIYKRSRRRRIYYVQSIYKNKKRRSNDYSLNYFI